MRITFPARAFVVADMRTLHLASRHDGILAWNSFFHLRRDDQRAMFSVFRAHAAPDAALMFTQARATARRSGTFQGEPLYHASLSPDEYRALLDRHGFEVVAHEAEDPGCGGHTIWLARLRRKTTEPSLACLPIVFSSGIRLRTSPMVNHCCSAEGRGISDVRFRGASRPMTRGYLDRPDCRVYYEVAGDGPLLVFAHGLGGNHLSWWQQVPHFRDRYTCVTFAIAGSRLRAYRPAVRIPATMRAILRL